MGTSLLLSGAMGTIMVHHHSSNNCLMSRYCQRLEADSKQYCPFGFPQHLQDKTTIDLQGITTLPMILQFYYTITMLPMILQFYYNALNDITISLLYYHNLP
jgi:hypothetical protein